jgi:hypothetical protein
VVKDQIRALREQLRVIKGAEAEVDSEGQGVVAKETEGADDGDGDGVVLSPGSEETDETLVVEEGWLEEEAMEEVRVDPKHWPFKLPLVAAERRREEVEAVEMVVQSE